jgi:geranyl-CoA carboxylase alpha subunit
VGDSYLDQKKIIQLAKSISAEAIHPGYGFLSENSAFARKVIEAGLIWIGPSPEAMDMVASKSHAKEVARKAGVPVLSGLEGNQELSAFLKAAEELGYPVLLKAVAGGGGRGIRKVESPNDLKSQLEIARSEAMNAFGDDEILLEKFVPEAHHVEVQVFGDDHGNVVHLFERDCSAQRKNQKVIEETPSPAISDELREKICSSAVSIAREARYQNAGTVEFLVTPQGDYYFLEMNTRLQVEHPVTEAVTKLDLVEWQIRIARGENLPVTQDKIASRGHAIELRLYAEDPSDGMRPQTGRIRGFHFSSFRNDHFLTDRTAITPFYDSMLAKIIVHGKDREEARTNALTALSETRIWGVKTNADYLRTILESPFFKKGKTLTRSLESLTATENVTADGVLPAEIAAAFMVKSGGDSWSNSAGRKQLVLLGMGKEEVLFEVTACENDFLIKGKTTETILKDFSIEGAFVSLVIDGTKRKVPWLREGNDFYLEDCEIRNVLYDKSSESKKADPDAIMSPMDGTIIRILKNENEAVSTGETIAILEAMKMQTELRSPRQGRIHKIHVTEKQMVRNRQLIIDLHKEKP